jgi:ferredoxin
MRLKIDAVLCTGHGRCAKFGPDIYKLDDLGYNADRGKTIAVPPSQEAAARKGAKFCPERAVEILED